MSERPDEFDEIRQERDPVRRGQRATRLLTLYQQRATELARLRKAAIEEAHQERGMTYTEIASAIGLTKGRVTQIRQTGPRPEREFFGVGPVSVGIPYRYATTDRERPLIAAEDAETGEQIEKLLAALGFAVTRYQIEPGQADPPPGDTVVVCGPKSADVGAALLASDPVMGMGEYDGRWWIEDRQDGHRFGSPSDDDPPQSADLAYLARRKDGDRVVVHIAGLHVMGSLGAAHYLTGNVAAILSSTGDASFSMVIRAAYDGRAIITSDIISGPFSWVTKCK
ncbi:MAG: hypothetical protein J2P25_07310 [Nocardiopsaceae bacterium]|nr:hypothetical protein [Nocardiopsaceae bacterium]